MQNTKKSNRKTRNNLVGRLAGLARNYAQKQSRPENTDLHIEQRLAILARNYAQKQTSQIAESSTKAVPQQPAQITNSTSVIVGQHFTHNPYQVAEQENLPSTPRNPIIPINQGTPDRAAIQSRVRHNVEFKLLKFDLNNPINSETTIVDQSGNCTDASQDVSLSSSSPGSASPVNESPELPNTPRGQSTIMYCKTPDREEMRARMLQVRNSVRNGNKN